jgi:hypothetical protein
MFDRGQGRAAGPRRGGLGDVKLPAGLPDSEQPLRGVEPGRGRKVRNLLHVADELGQVIVGELV